MTINAGGWNRGKFGSTLVWGYQFACVGATANVYDAAIAAAMAQTSPQNLDYSVVVTVDGTDVSAFFVAGEIRLNGQGGHSISEIELVTPLVVPTARVSEITISIKVTIASGSYTVERFRGKAHEVTAEDRPEGRAYRVLCFGAGYQLAVDKPSSVFGNRYYFSSSGITARQFIDDMLIYSGLSPLVGTFTDYTPRIFIPSQYQSNLEAIQALASGITVAQLYVLPSGLVRISTVDDPVSSPFSFPLTAQYSQDPDASLTDAFNRVQFTTAGVSAPAYNDLAKQATQGVISRNVNARFCTTAAQVQALGKANVDWSQKTTYRWETPLNPFVTPGETATLTLQDSTTKSVQITTCVDSLEVGNFQSSWEGRA